jgi:hypothetical protein
MRRAKPLSNEQGALLVLQQSHKKLLESHHKNIARRGYGKYLGLGPLVAKPCCVQLANSMPKAGNEGVAS